MRQHASPVCVPSDRRPARLRRIGLAAAVAALFALGPAPAALAHDQLVGTTPSSDETVASAPSEVSLEFSNSLLELGTEIRVTNSAGESVTSGEPSLNARFVTQALASNLPDDAYTVVWRVVSSDSHPISGSFSFGVGTASPADLTAPSTPPSAQPTAESPAAAESGDGLEWGLRVGLIALGGLILGGAVYATIVIRARRK